MVCRWERVHKYIADRAVDNIYHGRSNDIAAALGMELKPTRDILWKMSLVGWVECVSGPGGSADDAACVSGLRKSCERTQFPGGKTNEYE
jgi:hypothetical protein